MNVTTSRVTDTTGSFVLVRTMESVSVETVSVRASGMWRGTQLVSAGLVTIHVSPRMENTLANFVQGTESASVGSASVKQLKMDNTQENTAKTALHVREDVRS